MSWGYSRAQIELAPLPREVRNTFCPAHPGGKAAAAATRHLDYSEINNLVKSQDRAGAREGAPGETSTTTRAEKKRKPASEGAFLVFRAGFRFSMMVARSFDNEWSPLLIIGGTFLLFFLLLACAEMQVVDDDKKRRKRK